MSKKSILELRRHSLALALKSRPITHQMADHVLLCDTAYSDTRDTDGPVLFAAACISTLVVLQSTVSRWLFLL
jgi:hypothetical protein